jgi:hypothetical protein
VSDLVQVATLEAGGITSAASVWITFERGSFT